HKQIPLISGKVYECGVDCGKDPGSPSRSFSGARLPRIRKTSFLREILKQKARFFNSDRII
ncbi:MAG: hypothetical protein V5A59_13450, partial [Bacteroidales bacterium]